MADLDLDAIEARANAATAGPWRWWTSNSHRRLSSDATGKDGDVAHGCTHRDGCTDITIRPEDAAFIEAARSDVPALVAEVRRLRIEQEAICDADVRLLEEVNAALAQVTRERDAARADVARFRALLDQMADAATRSFDERLTIAEICQAEDDLIKAIAAVRGRP